MARFDVFVVPRSNNPGPHGRHGGLPRLRVKSLPAEGAANEECERRLTDLLGSRVTLVRGAQSRKKTFEVELGTEDVERLIARHFG